MTFKKGNIPWNKGKVEVQVAWNKGKHYGKQTTEQRKLYCKEYKQKNKNKINKRNYGYRLKDKEHFNQLRVLRYRNKKIKAINYLGNKCIDCGVEYNGNNGCIFQFHHRDINEKDNWLIRLLPLGWEKIKNEIDKCDLLCANCHFLRHNNF